MAMNQLPLEPIERVLMFLHPWDRLNSALTCRVWAEAVCSPMLLEDIWLVISAGDAGPVSQALLESRRGYRNLRLFKVDLSEIHPNLWTKVGRQLRRLELKSCELKSTAFLFILRNCPKLEALTLTDCVRESRPPEGTSLDSLLVRESLLNIRSLCLEMIITEDFLDLLLGSMPNATSLTLELGPFDARPDLVPCLLNAKQMFTELDLSSFHLNLSDSQVISLVKAYSASLHELRLNCFSLHEETFAAIGNCMKLQNLFLEGAIFLRDDHLETIIRKSPNLRLLVVSCCDSLTNRSVARLHDLKQLRHLSLASNSGIPHYALRGLGDIAALESLMLPGTQFKIKDIGCLASLKNLRTLSLSAAMTPESIDMICENFENLEHLELRNCKHLSDADGVKFRSLKHLRSLELGLAVELSDRTFEEFVGTATLMSLTLDKCPLTDVGMASIAANHGRLKFLCLSDCACITDVGLATLFPREPHLKYLELRLCDSVTGRFLEELENSCPRLQSIGFSSDPTTIDATRVSSFKSRRPLVDLILNEYQRNF